MIFEYEFSGCYIKILSCLIHPLPLLAYEHRISFTAGDSEAGGQQILGGHVPR